MKHAYIVANELTHFNQTLVQDAGITTDEWSNNVVIMFEDAVHILTGSARLKGNVLRVKRNGLSHGYRLRDVVLIDLTKAIIRHIELKEISLKPEFDFPIGWQPIRPIAGVRIVAEGDDV